MRRSLRLLPPLLLALAIAAAWSSGLAQGLSWQGLAAHQATLSTLVAEHPAQAALLYAGAYAGACLLCLPTGALMMLAGGVLFGTAAGAALAVAAASLGAVLLFVLARTAFGFGSGATLPDGAVGRLAGRLRPRLERDGFVFLLSLRIVPLFPFWLTNLAPAAAGMRLAPFVGATVLGLIPVSVVFAATGSGLRDALGAGVAQNAAALASPATIAPLAGLFVLSAVPPLVAHLWRRPRLHAIVCAKR